MDYDRQRLLGEVRFRTGQYLRQASLTFDSQFEMLMRNS
jgi:hypothetical protein